MGQGIGQTIATVVKALSCQDCARYVCNSMECDSSCLECCQLHVQTNEIPIAHEDSSYSVEITGCCDARKE